MVDKGKTGQIVQIPILCLNGKSSVMSANNAEHRRNTTCNKEKEKKKENIKMKFINLSQAIWINPDLWCKH